MTKASLAAARGDWPHLKDRLPTKKSAIKLRYSEEGLHLIGKGLCFDVCSLCACVLVCVFLNEWGQNLGNSLKLWM